MEYTTSIYYTFSTIAQVLAAFLALSGVFVLFKLQELKQMQLVQVQYFLTELADKITFSLVKTCPEFALPLNTLYESETSAGMIEEMNFILSHEKVNNEPKFAKLPQRKMIVEKVEKYRNLIIVLTYISISLGIITITFSLIILGFTHLISESYAIWIIIIGIVLSVLTILTMSYGIILSLKAFNPIVPSIAND
jgi:hypothetical protein